MNLTICPDVNNLISSCFSPIQLIILECVSKSISPTSEQWKIKGFGDKADFKQIVQDLLASAENCEAEKLIKNYVFNASLSSFQVKEILPQGPEVKKYCLTSIGIQSITLKMFNPFEISKMNVDDRNLYLSKGGFEIMQKIGPSRWKVIKPDYSDQAYKLFDFEIGHSEAEMKKAYRFFTLALHPDKNSGNEARAHRFFLKFINTKNKIEEYFNNKAS